MKSPTSATAQNIASHFSQPEVTDVSSSVSNAPSSAPKHKKPSETELQALNEMAEASLANITKIQELIDSREEAKTRKNALDHLATPENETLENLEQSKLDVKSELDSTLQKKQVALDKLTSIAGRMQTIEAARAKRESHSKSRVAQFRIYFKDSETAESTIQAASAEKNAATKRRSDLTSQSLDNQRYIRNTNEKIKTCVQELEKLKTKEIERLHKKLPKSNALVKRLGAEKQPKWSGQVTASDERIKILNGHVDALTKRIMSGVEADNYAAERQMDKAQNIRMGILVGGMALINSNNPITGAVASLYGKLNEMTDSPEKEALLVNVRAFQEKLKEYIGVSLFSRLTPQVMTSVLLASAIALWTFKDIRQLDKDGAGDARRSDKAKRTLNPETTDEELYKFVLHVTAMATEKISGIVHKRVEQEMIRLIGSSGENHHIDPDSINKEEIKDAVEDFKKSLEDEIKNVNGKNSTEAIQLFKNLLELMEGESKERVINGAVSMVNTVCRTVLSGLAGDDSAFSKTVKSNQRDQDSHKKDIAGKEADETNILKTLSDLSKKMIEIEGKIETQKTNRMDTHYQMRDVKLTQEELDTVIDLEEKNGNDGFREKINELNISPSVANADKSKRARENILKQIESENEEYAGLEEEHTTLWSDCVSSIPRENILKTRIKTLESRITVKKEQLAETKQQIQERKDEIDREIAETKKEIKRLSAEEQRTFSELRKNPILLRCATAGAIDRVIKKHIEIKDRPDELKQHADKNGFASWFPSHYYVIRSILASQNDQLGRTDTETSRLQVNVGMKIGKGIRKSDVDSLRPEQSIEDIAVSSEIAVYDYDHASGKVTHLHVWVPRGD